MTEFNLDSLFGDDQPTLKADYVKAPFGWPGGKSKALDHIIPELPERSGYIELCGGSGAVLLARNESKLEVFNDRHSGVTDFFRCLHSRELKEQLIEALYPIIHSREMFHYAQNWESTSDAVERASLWYYMVVTSFGSQGRNFGRSTSGENIIAKKLANKIPLLDRVCKRMQNVLIENQDMFKIAEDFDAEDHVFFWDPPYYKTSAGQYTHELGGIKEQEKTHIKICTTAMNMVGFVAISSYPNDIYDSFNWDKKVEFESMIYSESHAFTAGNFKQKVAQDIGTRTQKECLYIKEAL